MGAPTNRLLLPQSQSAYFQDHVTKRNDGLWVDCNILTYNVLFPIQSEKSPDSGFFTCDPTKKCIMPSSRESLKGIIGRGHDLRLTENGPPFRVLMCSHDGDLWASVYRHLHCFSFISLLHTIPVLFTGFSQGRIKLASSPRTKQASTGTRKLKR